MTTQAQRRRSPMTWMLMGLGAAGIALAALLVSGFRISDEAGRPLGIPAVAVSPGPSATPTPTPTPSADDSPDVVDAPPPVTVQLDDHGGDGHGGGDNSGKGGGSDDG